MAPRFFRLKYNLSFSGSRLTVYSRLPHRNFGRERRSLIHSTLWLFQLRGGTSSKTICIICINFFTVLILKKKIAETSVPGLTEGLEHLQCFKKKKTRHYSSQLSFTKDENSPIFLYTALFEPDPSSRTQMAPKIPSFIWGVIFPLKNLE